VSERSDHTLRELRQWLSEQSEENIQGSANGVSRFLCSRVYWCIVNKKYSISKSICKKKKASSAIMSFLFTFPLDQIWGVGQRNC